MGAELADLPASGCMAAVFAEPSRIGLVADLGRAWVNFALAAGGSLMAVFDQDRRLVSAVWYDHG